MSSDRRLSFCAWATVLVVAVCVRDLAAQEHASCPTGYTPLEGGACYQWRRACPMTESGASRAALPLSPSRVLLFGSQEPIEVLDYDRVSGEISWTQLGQGRRLRTAVLSDGRVLAIVQEYTTPESRIAYLGVYDPATRAWRDLGELGHPLAGGLFLPLADGRVLVTGGQDADRRSGTAATCFDPDSLVWSPCGEMAEPRFEHRAAPLADGRWVLFGGRNDTGTLELFDPTVSAWQNIPAPGPAGGWPAPHRLCALVPLDDRRILTFSQHWLDAAQALEFGGDGGAMFVALPWIVDLSEASWQPAPELLGEAVSCPSLHIDAEGAILALRAEPNDDPSVVTVERLPVGAAAWQRGADFAEAGRDARFRSLPSGRIFLQYDDRIGDEDGYVMRCSYPLAGAVYDPQADRWHPIPALLAAASEPAATTVPWGERLLVLADSSGLGDQVLLYDTTSEAWFTECPLIGEVDFDADAGQGLLWAASWEDGRLLTYGRLNAGRDALELRSPDSGLWRQLSTIAGPAYGPQAEAPHTARDLFLAHMGPDEVSVLGTVSEASEIGAGRLETWRYRLSEDVWEHVDPGFESPGVWNLGVRRLDDQHALATWRDEAGALGLAAFSPSGGWQRLGTDGLSPDAGFHFGVASEVFVAAGPDGVYRFADADGRWIPVSLPGAGPWAVHGVQAQVGSIVTGLLRDQYRRHVPPPAVLLVVQVWLVAVHGALRPVGAEDDLELAHVLDGNED